MAQNDSLVIAALGRTEKAKLINMVAKLFHPISELKRDAKMILLKQSVILLIKI